MFPFLTEMCPEHQPPLDNKIVCPDGVTGVHLLRGLNICMAGLSGKNWKDCFAH